LAKIEKVAVLIKEEMLVNLKEADLIIPF